MSIITKVLVQTAVLWSHTLNDYDELGGDKVSDPVEISCRWSDMTTKVLNSQGDEILSTAKVMVDRDIEPGSYLRLGLLSELSDADTPINNTKTYKVQSFSKTPDIRGAEFLRQVYL